jgi:hypothetical protein
MAALLQNVPEIAQFRVEQTSLDRLVVSAVMRRPLSEASEMLVRSEIAKAFGHGTVYELQPVAHIPRLRSGKQRVTVGMSA